MTTEQYNQLTEGLERYGLPTLFALALLFLLYLLIDAIRSRLKTDGQNDIEDTKIHSKNADTTHILATVLQGNTTALTDIKTTMNASVGAYEKLYGLQHEDHKLIEDIHKSEGKITSHIDTLINPYQKVHEGHTTKLLSLIETGRVLVESVEGLKSQGLQLLDALEAISETVKMLAQESDKLNIIELSNDNHKDKNHE